MPEYGKDEEFETFYNKDYEYEITIPPGIFTIQKIENIMINGDKRVFVTTTFTQISKEQSLCILKSID
jgi:hypothetical protein